jgi:hypothetical protein
MRKSFWLFVALATFPWAGQAGTTFPQWMSNGLVRSLDVRERTYFGKPLADVVAAIDSVSRAKQHGACVAQTVSGETSSNPKPADLIRDQGRLTPKGVAPMSWEVAVACPEFKVEVALSGDPVVIGGDTGVGAPQGSDVFVGPRQLVIGEFSLHTTGASADTQQTLDELPSLVRPRAITIRYEKSPGKPADFIDLEAARAAQASVKPSPPRSPPAVEVEEIRGTDDDRRKAESSVYSFLLGRSGKHAHTLVVDTTWRGSLPAEAEQVLPEVAPELLGSAIADYRARNQESQPLPTDLVVPGSAVTRIDEATLKTYFQAGTGPEGWERFRKQFGEDAMYTFSRAGFSHDLSQAVVFMGFQGAHVGTGSLYFLLRQGQNWRVLYQLRLSVS